MKEPVEEPFRFMGNTYQLVSEKVKINKNKCEDCIFGSTLLDPTMEGACILAVPHIHHKSFADTISGRKRCDTRYPFGERVRTLYYWTKLEINKIKPKKLNL